ncbi:HXXEE domain-containing protein [Fredinandcohnia sp. QZ13]|uniref:HXXEE domain-containing protein n=1 Tax=Fredinandcohnia sp. QZ13 TaxID=3073144 RepID=UPI0028536CA4|nr:HXXEE domain-containing protein [Fredinandcohnia sp. QZ13]MDR4889859.1 HXXEE domain-containing protein [Fredinandcohnia sp. QZ13]
MSSYGQYQSSIINLFILLFPPLYLIHDIEEIFTVEPFLIEHSDIIPFHVTTLEFAVAFSLLWVIASIGCYQTSRERRFLGMKPVTYLSFLVPGIILANAIGHVLQFLYFKDYVPGMITSILILIPYSFVTARFLIMNGKVTVKKLVTYFLIGFVVQGPLALLAHIFSSFIVE